MTKLKTSAVTIQAFIAGEVKSEDSASKLLELFKMNDEMRQGISFLINNKKENISQYTIEKTDFPIQLIVLPYKEHIE